MADSTSHNSAPSSARADAEDALDMGALEPCVFEDDCLEEAPVFKALECAEEAFVDADVDGFDEEDVERGLDDGLMFLPPLSMVRGDVMGDFVAAPSTPGAFASVAAPCTLESVVSGSALEGVEAPAMKPAPFFLDATHFITTASAGIVAAAVAGLLLKAGMAASFSEDKMKFKAAHYEGADCVEFRVYVHYRPASGDRVVEFCRRQGSRALWARTYKNLVATLAEQGVAPRSVAAVRTPVDISAPLPVPDLDDDEASFGPSSEASEAQKVADLLLACSDDAPEELLSKACAILAGADMLSSAAPFAAAAVVGRLVAMAGSHNPGVARAALAILVDLSSLVCSERGPEDLALSFDSPATKALAASLNIVFRHSDGLANFRYAEIFGKALELVCNLAADEDMSRSLCDSGVDSLVRRLRDSSASSPALHEQANVAFMSLCVAA